VGSTGLDDHWASYWETVEGFRTRGLAFRSLEERFDTGSDAGELVFHVFGAIAHLERRLIAERTRDGRGPR
jgi:DNA invertase Pin-like site-specific DNA recombinase